MSLRSFVTIRSAVPRGASIVLGAIPVVVMLLLWWFATAGAPEERRIAPTILPSPVEVVRSVPELVHNRDLLHHVWASVRRVGLSFLLALAIVLPLGILMGSFGGVSALFAPTSTASGYIPIATLVPLTMSWFGIDELQKIMFLAMAFGIYLLPLVVNAIEAVPDIYLRTSYTLGATRFDVIRHVLIPIALPDLWRAMRLAFGVGWTYIVLAEVVVMVDGLGFLIQNSFRRGPREHIYLVILVITLIAWVADLAWQRMGRLLFPYRRDRL
ncbi:MAG TPA: ABC transporter permease subunit [Terriglobia bacterium]|nr:ABC transporter permease subunit [Terriglobia bacterium]